MATIACPCPPKADGTPRHEHDTVTLRERLDFHGALAAKRAVGLLRFEDPGADHAAILATLTEQYVLHGVESWTLVDEKNQPVPVTKPAIRQFLLSDLDAVGPLLDEVDEAYSEQVYLPLVAEALRYSQRSQTNGSTSPRSDSTPKRPKPSKRSSTSTSPTAGTARTT